MKISVIIPAYNEEKLIGKCLDALVAQTRQVDEIVVIDNNSTDRTADIAKKYKNVTVIAEKQQGMTYARTAGFNYAHGDIVGRIDADSVVSPTWAAAIENEFLADPSIDALCGDSGIAEISPRGYFIGTSFCRLLRHVHKFYFGFSPIIYGPNGAIRKSAWEIIEKKVTNGDASISEDIDITICLLKEGRKLKHVPKMIANIHVRRAMSISKLLRYIDNDKKTVTLHQYGKQGKKAA